MASRSPLPQIGRRHASSSQSLITLHSFVQISARLIMSQNLMSSRCPEWMIVLTLWDLQGMWASLTYWRVIGKYHWQSDQEKLPLLLHPLVCTGIKSCPSVSVMLLPRFSDVMNLVVGDMDGCAVYLDNVVIYSDDWESHLYRVRALFKRLLAANLTVNLTKCEFA